MIRNDHRVVAGRAPHAAATGVPDFPQIITADPHFQRILARLPLYASSDLPVLLTGEPGTGKELVAAALWALSPRRRCPCQRLNCSALTESLSGSELFGHLKGAFTDACTTRPGKFRLAHKGTLFLDEIGDLPLSIQPRLLRAVEQGEIEPVGGDTPIKVDVRLLAATNQDLSRLIPQGRFRQDLYDRLAVLTIHLPPLRQRGEDVLLLARHFTQEAGRRYRRILPLEFSPGARGVLLEYSWPGNVRELRNVIYRVVLFAAGPQIRSQDLSWSLPSAARAPQEAPPHRPSPDRLLELLAEEKGNVSALARRLRVATKTIYRWVRSHHLDLTRLRRLLHGAVKPEPGPPKKSLPFLAKEQAARFYWEWSGELEGRATVSPGPRFKFF
jgi:transcriptional regulator with GAF, ATPase, and Fis domain